MSGKTAIFSLAMAIVCFGVALVPLLGLVLVEDQLGRFIFTGLWVMLGFVWIGNYRRTRAKEKSD